MSNLELEHLMLKNLSKKRKYDDISQVCEKKDDDEETKEQQKRINNLRLKTKQMRRNSSPLTNDNLIKP